VITTHFPLHQSHTASFPGHTRRQTEQPRLAIQRIYISLPEYILICQELPSRGDGESRASGGRRSPYTPQGAGNRRYVDGLQTERAQNRSSQIKGLSHVALVVEICSGRWISKPGVLGFSLIKTLQLAGTAVSISFFTWRWPVIARVLLVSGAATRWPRVSPSRRTNVGEFEERVRLGFTGGGLAQSHRIQLDATRFTSTKPSCKPLYRCLADHLSLSHGQRLWRQPRMKHSG